MFAPALVIVLMFAQRPQLELTIRAVQHSGWWELQYDGRSVAVNEMHVPAGRRVIVETKLDGPALWWSSASAIYTFRLRRPNVSKLLIFTDDPRQFDSWLARQRSAATIPSTAEATRGRDVFLTARCTLCHSVRGVAVAEEPLGPDLTHVASRATLASGALPNHAGELAAWIVDAETLKPGAGMPINNIEASELQLLLAYLRTLR
ncbi:MAG TPA: c-type cytochrome [Thermoanaerobaculia bacterium]